MMLICLEAGGGGRAEDRRGGCGRPPAGRATTSQRDVVRLSQGKVPGVLAVGGARAGRGGAGVVPNCRWVAVSSNQFQFEKIMRRRNQNAACLTGWAVSVGSERGLAGAARAERRALPTRVSSDRQLRLLPLILMNCGSFQSIPNTFLKIMRRSAENLSAGLVAVWVAFSGHEAGADIAPRASGQTGSNRLCGQRQQPRTRTRTRTRRKNGWSQTGANPVKPGQATFEDTAGGRICLFPILNLK